MPLCDDAAIVVFGLGLLLWVPLGAIFAFWALSLIVDEALMILLIADIAKPSW